jgi:signal transduction histidine kinase/Tfp pilus assembly protein PilF
MILAIILKSSIVVVPEGSNYTFRQIFRSYVRKKGCFLALFALFYLFFPVGMCVAQSLDSLMVTLKQMEKEPGFEKDTSYLNTANELGYYLAETNPDSAFLFLDRQLEWCRNAKFSKGEAEALKIYGNAFQAKGDFKGSLDYYSRALTIAKTANEEKIIPGILNNIGLVHFNLGNYSEALNTYFVAIKGAEKVNNNFVKAAVLNNIAYVYLELENLDDAEAYYLKVLEIDSMSGDVRRMIQSLTNIGDVRLLQNRPLDALLSLRKAYKMAIGLESPDLIEMSSRTLASIYVVLDSSDRAENFFRESISISKQHNYGVPLVKSMIGLSELLYKNGNYKEALGFAIEAKDQAEKMHQTILMRNAHNVLSKIYEAEGNTPAALKSYKLFTQYNDSINDLRSKKVAATLEAEYEFSKKALEFEKASQRQRWIIFSAFAGLFTFLVILFIIARNKRILNKAYHTLQEKTVEIENKNETLEQTLNQLQSAQLQLIQAEKMASLGELTAGIAHEIQNPLNFIINFSELNSEMVDEINTELEKGNETEINYLLSYIKDNTNKIGQHGKRADAIVKGMLAHSRSQPGERMVTDINRLAKEYLRLTYQGLKTKFNDFEAEYHFEPAVDLPNIEILPQEIGRAFFNVMQNAFYAVYERKNAGDPNYKPFVEVLVKIEDDQIKVMVRDNGMGIPSSILNKIFQPFFTTKPTGQGTGLGLSLSYDIVKAHGGEIKVHSEEQKGSEFIIVLPVK